MIRSVLEVRRSLVVLVLLVSSWSCVVAGNTTIPQTTFPTPWPPCCYGNTTLQHGDTVLELPGCCIRLLCCFGVIVKSNRVSVAVLRDHEPCHDYHDHHDHTWDNTTTTTTLSRHLDDSYGNCCVLGDWMYPPGYILTTFCLRMVCHDGHWDFAWSFDPDCGHCWVHNYPHFTTFDGHHFNWYGLCNYTLTQTNSSNNSSDPHTAVYVKFKKCFRRRRARNMPTCLSRVTFREDPHTIITLTTKNATSMTVNGEAVAVPDAHDLKRVVTSHGLHPVLAIKIAGCPTLIGASGFVVMVCQHRVDVWVSQALADEVDGLCGPFNPFNTTNTTEPWRMMDYERYNTTLFPLMWLADNENLLKCNTNDPDINNAARCTKSTDKFVAPCDRNTRGNQYLSETCQYDLCKLSEKGPKVARWLIRRWKKVVRINAYVTERIANSTQEYYMTY